MEKIRFRAQALGTDEYIEGGYVYCKEDDTHYIGRIECRNGVHLPCYLRVEPTTLEMINDRIKYSLGDRVWFPEIYDGEYYVKKDGYIIDSVNVTNDQFGTNISYTLQGEYGQYRQNRLYSSYKEAKESSERGNC